MNRWMQLALLMLCMLLSACGIAPPANAPGDAAQTPAMQEKTTEAEEPAALGGQGTGASAPRLETPMPAATPVQAFQTAPDAAAPPIEGAANHAETPEGTPAPENGETDLADGENVAFAQDGPAGSDAYIDLALERLGLGTQEQAYEVIVTHQSDELFSCIVDLGGKPSTIVAYTCTKPDGRECALGDFFTSSDTGWRSLLPDLVTQSALEQGMTLLCAVPPVSASHPFYIQDGNIVLLYRPYEITTYEAGSPQFVLDMQAVAEYTSGVYGVGSAYDTEEIPGMGGME